MGRIPREISNKHRIEWDLNLVLDIVPISLQYQRAPGSHFEMFVVVVAAVVVAPVVVVYIKG